MAIHIVRQMWSTIIFVTIIAFSVIAYYLPDTPYIGALSEPITAMVGYVLAINIFFLPIYKKWHGYGVLVLTAVSLVISWFAVYWLYLKPG